MKAFEKNVLEQSTIFLQRNSSTQNTYSSALFLFWNTAYEQSIAKVSDFLATNDFSSEHLAFYRLWIENLVHLVDEKGLEQLKIHLLTTARCHDDYKTEIFALIGTIFTELHDFDAAAVFARALESNYGSPYVNEFMAKSAGTSRNITSRMLANKPVFTDYFHLQTLAFHAATDFSNAVLLTLKRLYPGHPLENVFEFHKSVAIKNYAAARIHAQALTRTYAQNRDYLFYECFALVQIKKFEEAITKILDAAKNLELDVSSDPDFHHLLATAYESQIETVPASQGLALNHRQFATALLKANAHSTFLAKKKLQEHFDTYVETQSFIEHETNDQFVNSLSAVRHWMVKLNQSDFLQMMTAPTEKIKEIEKPLGKDIKKGELCFILANAPSIKSVGQREVWSLGAIYECVTQPAWDPIHGHVVTLRLVERIEDRILIDVVLQDKELEKENSNSHDVSGSSWNIFEMDDSALARLTDSIKRRNDGIDHSSERRSKNYTQKKPM